MTPDKPQDAGRTGRVGKGENSSQGAARTPGFRLLSRLEREFGPGFIAPSAKIRRTYAGVHQRSAGAWSWAIDVASEDLGKYTVSIGSQYPVTKLLRAKELTLYTDPWGQVAIDPSTADLLRFIEERKAKLRSNFRKSPGAAARDKVFRAYLRGIMNKK